MENITVGKTTQENVGNPKVVSLPGLEEAREAEELRRTGNPMTRSQLTADFKSNHEDMAKEASNNRLSLAEYLNDLSPEPSDEYDTPSAVYSIAAHQGLRMKDLSDGRYASTCNDFLETPGGELLLRGCLSEYYRLGSHVVGRAGVSDLPTTDGWRTVVEGTPKDAKKRGLRLPFQNIVGVSDVITGDSYVVREATTPEHADMMMAVSEGTKIPEVTIQVGTRVVTFYKLATSLRVTYEWMRNSNIRTTELTRRVDKIRIAHDKLRLKKGLQTIMSEVEAHGETYNTKEVGEGSGNGLSYSKETLMELMFELDEPYMVDTVVAGPAVLVKYLGINTGSQNRELSVLDRVLAELTTGVSSINSNIMIANQWAGIKEDIVADKQANAGGTATGGRSDSLDIAKASGQFEEMLFFDSTETLGFIRQRGGDISERERDIQSQTFLQTFSSTEGQYVYDWNGRLKTYMNPS